MITYDAVNIWCAATGQFGRKWNRGLHLDKRKKRKPTSSIIGRNWLAGWNSTALLLLLPWKKATNGKTRKKQKIESSTHWLVSETLSHLLLDFLLDQWCPCQVLPILQSYIPEKNKSERTPIKSLKRRKIKNHLITSMSLFVLIFLWRKCTLSLHLPATIVVGLFHLQQMREIEVKKKLRLKTMNSFELEWEKKNVPFKRYPGEEAVLEMILCLL